MSATRWHPVEVIARHAPEPIPAVRDGDIVVYDLIHALPIAAEPERAWRERTFVLLDGGVQLERPHRWLDLEPDAWYVDLIAIEASAS